MTINVPPQSSVAAKGTQLGRVFKIHDFFGMVLIKK